MKIAIFDDGIGAFALLNKLKYHIYADYTVYVLTGSFPLGQLNKPQLFTIAKQAVNKAVEEQYDAVVLSSIALSMASVKTLQQQYPNTALYGCEAPILHACTYTASQVLTVGDDFVCRIAKRFPNVIALPLTEFPTLVESGADDRKIVSYISEHAEQYYGNFDCIALGNSSMNAYKHCFSCVFPNAKIFDSVEGVVRRMRKKFKKSANLESTVRVLDEHNESLDEKYKFFIDEF